MRRLDPAIAAVRRALARATPVARRGVEAAGRELATARGRAVAAAALGAIVLVVAVVSTGDDPPSASPRGAGAEGSGGAKAPRPISDVFEAMSTEDKVAQLVLVGLEGTTADDPALQALGELGYGGIVIDERNYVSPDQVSQLADEAVSVAEAEDHPAPWVMAAQEGGEFSALADLPPEDAPADLGPPGEAGDLAEETAEELLEVGVTGILGPVVDVGTAPGSALGERLYSDDPREVRGYALATLEAFEETDLFSAAKHFPGIGGAAQSPEFGPANVGLSLEQLAASDLIPFEAAIEAGVPGIVVGHGLYGVDDFVTPASLSKTIVTGLLRDELGFEGVAIADDLTSPAITSGFRTPAAAVDSVAAGADMVHVSEGDDEQRAVVDALLEAVRDGDISRERLDEAVIRTLLAKEDAGLVEGGSGRSDAESEEEG